MGLKRIRLLGILGQKFGASHRLDVATPAEAVRALCANFPEFSKFLIDSEKDGVGYRCIADAKSYDPEKQHHDPFSKSFAIVPVIGGAKSGFLGILLGAALIGLSFVLPPVGIIGTTTLSSVAFGIGASMVLGGISQMLSPQPKSDTPKEAPANQPSYQFDGPVNTTKQGQPVPVGYGRLIVGSAVISAGLSSVRISQ